MTDHKFTDDDVIKALECCMKAEMAKDCELMKCPAYYKNGCIYFDRADSYDEYSVYRELTKDALALINRQKAEIESLKKIGDDKTSEILRHATAIGELHKQLETAKSEAIKEFAERLLKKIYPYAGVDKKTYAINAYAVEVAIRNTIKEVDNG